MDDATRNEMVNMMAEQITSGAEVGQTYAASIVFCPNATRDQVAALLQMTMVAPWVLSVAIAGPA